jgi:hypothetical protein
LGQHDIDHVGHGLLAGPVALELDGQRDPTDRLRSGPDNTLETRTKSSRRAAIRSHSSSYRAG